MSQASDLVDRAIETLSEHFDSIIILATVYDGEGATGGSGTRVVCKRHGNYYATKGVVIEWLEEERNRDLAEKLNAEGEA